METFFLWLADSWLAHLTLDHAWFFPLMEIVHFVGLCLLIGAVGLVDLRLLGFAAGLSLAALDRVLLWAFVGFGLNLVSGALMFAADPAKYYTNPVFIVKLGLVLAAALNALVFRSTVRATDGCLGPNGQASRRARLMAAGSLTLWSSVIVAGRLLPYLGAGG